MVHETVGQIKSIIEDKFPSVCVTIDEISDTCDIFVMIDNKDVYESDDYLILITEISINVLLKKGISNVFFSYASPRTKRYIEEKDVSAWVSAQIPFASSGVKLGKVATVPASNTKYAWISHEGPFVMTETYEYTITNLLTGNMAEMDVGQNWTFHKNQLPLPNALTGDSLCNTMQYGDNEDLKLAA